MYVRLTVYFEHIFDSITYLKQLFTLSLEAWKLTLLEKVKKLAFNEIMRFLKVSFLVRFVWRNFHFKIRILVQN